jgi:hypothetical protein
LNSSSASHYQKYIKKNNGADYISIMTANRLEGLKPVPKTSCILNIHQTMDSAQHNYGVAVLVLFYTKHSVMLLKTSCSGTFLEETLTLLFASCCVS